MALEAELIDVRSTSATGSDYNPNSSGADVTLVEKFRISDLLNGASQTSPATVSDFDFSAPMDCATTAAPDIGATCSLTTTANSITPGAIKEQNKAVVQVFRVRLNDSGNNGTRGDADDRNFAMQGVYIREQEPPAPAPGPSDPPAPDPSTVASPLARTTTTPLADATEFLYTGADPIQVGVGAGTIEPRRASVLRGHVKDRSGSPIPGVRITVRDHPEFGRTATRTDGGFEMAVNGGGSLTTEYERQGYIPVRRQVDVPWQDYLDVEDVVMVPYDHTATEINLGSNASMQVAAGSKVTDGDGSRKPVLMFPGGTTASMTLANGSSQSINNLTLRATEFTVGDSGPEAMPAELPTTSAYTYAVDFSVDQAVAQGASDVTFSQPVPAYVDNFVGFPIGETVPVGYWDEEKQAWVPADSGLVVKIHSEAGGIAELEVDGSGQAASQSQLDTLGITNAERRRLSDLYDTGQELWRFKVTHFSYWDVNWGISPPDDAAPPGIGPSSLGKRQDGDCQGSGSVLECEDQVLGEEQDVTGSELTLNYRSDRAPGREATRAIKIPLTGASPPASLKRIELTVEVAGKRFSQSFSAAPNQDYTYHWDGQDAYGRTVQGSQPATVDVGYVYDGVYQRTSRFGYSGNGERITGTAGRQELTFSRSFHTTVGSWDARGQGLGGWSLSAQHVYDPSSQTLYMGDGTRRSIEGTQPVIDTVAGGGIDTGPQTPLGDGGQAKGAVLGHDIYDLDFGPDGSLYIADDRFDRIRRVAPDGIISTIAGKYDPNCPFGGCATGDGGPAADAELGSPWGIAVGPDGSIYTAEYHAHIVRRITPDGIIRTVAGSGSGAVNGDGGPALDAGLGDVYDVEVAPDGTLYVSASNKVRRVAPDGTITTIHGCCQTGIDLAPDGSLYLASGNRVVRLAPDGSERTVAGGGSGGPGDPATDASIGDWARDVAVAKDGSFYIATWFGNRLLRVDTDGILREVAGTGAADSTWQGDGIPAKGALLPELTAVAVGPDGSVYVPHYSNTSRVRRIDTPLPRFTGAEISIPSEDGTELYEFDGDGRHLRTLNTLTGATLYSFSYDNGVLASITDGDGNSTEVQHDGQGNPTAITAPFGQQTTLDSDSNGFLSSTTNPASETTAFSYSDDGLLQTLTDPRNGEKAYSYDTLGRLERADDQGDGFKTLSRTDTASSYETTLETKLGRSSKYKVEQLSAGDLLRTYTDPAGQQSTLQINQDGSRTSSAADGTTTSMRSSPDPRFGMNSPLLSSLHVATPGGLSLYTQGSRLTTPANLDDPLSFQTITDTLSVNGRPYQTTFNASQHRFTTTSPEARQTVTDIDAQGRPTLQQVPGIAALGSAYNTHGQLETQTQGNRAWTYTYKPGGSPDSGFLDTITDPLQRVTSFGYDNAGRVTTQTLPGGRQVTYTYDDNGNLSSITPPSQPAHSFTHTPVDLLDDYLAPQVGSEPRTTHYTYNDDQDLTKITRPDAVEINFGYDAAGRLHTINQPRGDTTLDYDSQTGNLSSITAPGNEGISLGYDGSLPTQETFSGTISGSASRTYDNDLRLASSSVDGSNTVNYSYDGDSLLTGAGDLSLTRDTQNGLLSGTTLQNTTTSQHYNAFGEPDSQDAKFSGSTLYGATYTRDDAGRIASKTETTSQGTHTYGYTYDDAGRLADVTKDGGVPTQYRYDANGNRTQGPSQPLGLPVIGMYDHQDRLMSYGSTNYTYTAGGELQTKTVSGVPNNQTTTYGYDVLGSLENVTLPDGTLIDYVNDGYGRRIAKKRNGQLSQGFLYGDQALGPVAELDSQGSVQSRFVYATRANVPDYMTKNGNTYRVVTDQLGSPRMIVDATSGQIAEEIDYDEFGNVTRDTNPGFQPFGFAGGVYDMDTKLNRFGARDYDPEVGRWTVKDPTRFEGGDTNLYGYVLSDPVNLLDPQGLWWHPSIDVGNGLNWLTDRTAAALADSRLFLMNRLCALQRIQALRRVGLIGTGALVAVGSVAAIVGGGIAAAACFDAIESPECSMIGAGGLGVGAAGLYASYRLIGQGLSKNP